MLNNRGFTLIEVLASLVVITLISIIVVTYASDTLSINKNKAYELMKQNISKISKVYVKECEAGISNCNLNWDDNSTYFYVEDLKNNGYFKNTRSPIDGKDIGKCLSIKAFKDNGVIDIELVDNCY